MQRSRKALLERRVLLQKSLIMSGKKHIYKVSISVVIFLWIFVLLLNCLISQGDVHGDELAAASVESVKQEAQSDQEIKLDSSDALLATDEIITNSELLNSEGEIAVNGKDALVVEKPDIPIAAKEHPTEDAVDSGMTVEKEPSPKNERLFRITPLGLDEFKNKLISSKEKPISNQASTVIHRVEPGGKAYNYAAAGKGAKVLDFNKEAKGAANILDKDKDKYLRNPCSAEEKYVVIELSEETLVDTVEIANFEHYSSNLKDFEVFSSLEYPTDKWIKLGNFTAANTKHAQRFSLEESKWARYLRLNLLSHYGSEFYCTLSSLEVYGVDVVEMMLEDLMSVEKKPEKPEKQSDEPVTLQDPIDQEDPFEELFSEVNDQSVKRDTSKSIASDPVSETKPLQVGRMPGDTVLKVLMQKVQSLDMNLSVLERYLEELNSRYGRTFKDFDDDITEKEMLLETIKLEMKNLQQSKDAIANDLSDLLLWKTFVSLQLDQLAKDNLVLRSQVKAVQDHQISMENRGLAVIFLCFIFGSLALTKLFTDFLLSICRVCKSEKFCRTNPAWLVLLLSSSIIAFILIL